MTLGVDHGAWGTPVSAAHLGFAISVSSKRLLEYSLQVGARFDQEQKESILTVWRYAGYLMGIPETILYTNGAEAEEMYKMGYLCEPVPDADSIAVANGLIQAIPSVADVTDPDEQKRLTDLAYRLSRGWFRERSLGTDWLIASSSPRCRPWERCSCTGSNNAFNDG